MPAGSAPELILNQAQEQRKKQERHLQGLLRVATGGLVVLLSAGTIAVAASEALAPSTVVVVFAFACLLGLNLVLIEITAHRWRDGPDIDKLVQALQGRLSLSQLQVALVRALHRDYTFNDTTLRRLRWLVLIQAIIAFSGIVVLLTVLRELH